MIRNNWSKEEITTIYNKPLLDLVFEAASLHRRESNPSEIQMSTLLSVKTGGCPEDCSYCSQSARYQTALKGTPMLTEEEILQAALNAKANGSSRFCMGAAWREIKDNTHFDRIVSSVKKITDMGMEVCCTLGMLTEEQAMRLKEAGLHAYNHNLDTSPEYYEQVITTRTYEDRLKTIENVRKAGIGLCCGGIVGLGEDKTDRIGLLHTLSNFDKHPESVPINALVPVEGTPMADSPKLPFWEVLRTIATARIIMPKSQIRLSAGRSEMSIAEQALCFLAGANSIFAGEKLLTTANCSLPEDKKMLELLGLTFKPSEVQSSKNHAALTEG
ncbi:MAG: biotin synthase BioB [Candidatus Competibacteraceae bacterium]|nr:biotin synthase BioB [Candidatus Competibacteraceae bacterium]